MAVAMIYPEAKRGRGNVDPAKKMQSNFVFSQFLLEQAHFILKHAPELAQPVLAGAQSLQDAGRLGHKTGYSIYRKTS
ncbi:MAG: hypothetical protein JO071_07210 [Deltaproteobacteria bacterium]|nr:hypothetical protein [Deltaproteobacteria bacterium]